MDKKILKEYVDACKMVEETEEELKYLMEQPGEMGVDKVTGSMKEFPYIQTSFKVYGVDSHVIDKKVKSKKNLLEKRIRKADKIKTEVEKCMNDATIRIQRIVKYHYFDGLSWKDTAEKIGSGSGESIRKELERFLKNQ